LKLGTGTNRGWQVLESGEPEDFDFKAFKKAMLAKKQ